MKQQKQNLVRLRTILRALIATDPFSLNYTNTETAVLETVVLGAASPFY